MLPPKSMTPIYIDDQRGTKDKYVITVRGQVMIENRRWRTQDEAEKDQARLQSSGYQLVDNPS